MLTDSDFIAAETTNIPIVAESDTTSAREKTPPVFEPQPCCSRSLVDENSATKIPSPVGVICRDLTSSFENAPSNDILPIPAVQRKENRKNYRRGKLKRRANEPKKKVEKSATSTEEDCKRLYCSDSYLQSTLGCMPTLWTLVS